MDLGFTKEQQALRQSARDFLQRECPPTLVREAQVAAHSGHASDLWQQMADLGWLGLAFPECYGGIGASLVDLAILFEQAGRALVPTTLYSSIAGGLAILNGGTEAQKAALLPSLVVGELILTIALSEPNTILNPGFLQTRAVAEGDCYRLSGTKLFVQNAHLADYLIVVARTAQGAAGDGVTAFLVECGASGISCEPMDTFGEDRQSAVHLDNVRVPGPSVLGVVNRAWPPLALTLEQITALQCAEMVGGAQLVLDKTVEYMRQRVQFDRPLGSFQAVQHAAANVAIDVEGARYTTFQAVWRLSKGLPATREVAIAKVAAGEAYKSATLIAHQLHGGIGYIREYDLYLWSQRAKTTELSLGTRDHHLAAIAEQIGL